MASYALDVDKNAQKSPQKVQMNNSKYNQYDDSVDEVDAALGRVLIKYIDRLSDSCEDVDPLEKIVAEMLATARKVIHEC